MKYKLKSEFETSLTHEAFVADMIDCDQRITVVRFSGKPGYGGEGNYDAIYIISTIRTILEGSLPKAVVVDFSQVEYEFGNGMMKALDLRDQYGIDYFPDDLPHAVVNVKSSNVLHRLLKALGLYKEEFTDLEKAMSFVESEYKKLSTEQGEALNP